MIIPSALTITGTLVVLRWHIFSISFSKFLYLFILLHSLVGILLSVYTDISIRRRFFCFIVLNHYICSIGLYLSISLDSKIPENCSSFCFRYWFWSVFIPFFRIYLLLESFFFTSALADGLSLRFEWQQVSSSLQDSSQYSGWSQ